MPRSTRKKKTRSAKGAAGPPKTEDYLPDAGAITEVKELVSPRGKRYEVIVSTELDPYETGPEEQPEPEGRK